MLGVTYNNHATCQEDNNTQLCNVQCQTILDGGSKLHIHGMEEVFSHSMKGEVRRLYYGALIYCNVGTPAQYHAVVALFLSGVLFPLKNKQTSLEAKCESFQKWEHFSQMGCYLETNGTVILR